MRILFISDLYPIIEDKTIPNVVYDFALGFKKMNYDVCVIRPNFLFNSFLRGRKFVPQGEYCVDGIKIYNRNFFLPFLDDDISYLDGKFDLIISHMPCGHIYADLINKKLSTKHISILHQSDVTVLNDFKYSFYFKSRLLKALKNPTLLGARNKYIFEKLRADFILPSFVEGENIVSKKALYGAPLRIITLSKLIKRKNIDLAILALSKADFDFRYSIFGEGKEKKRLNSLIKKLKLDEKIKIYPFESHDKIYRRLDENDVFLLPSVNETFGVAYLEALSRGLIVIGTKNTGIDGIIKDNVNGFLVEPDVQSIKEALDKINSQDNSDIVKNSLLEIQNYKREKIMNKYDEIIKKIL